VTAQCAVTVDTERPFAVEGNVRMTGKARRLLVVLPLLAVTLASGCGVFRTWHASWPEYDNKNAALPIIGQDAFVKEVANRFGLMAWFAEVAYRRDVVEGDRPTPQAACDHVGWDTPLDFGIPHGAGGRWSRWLPNDGSVKACFNEDGLFYETYIYTPTGGPPEQAVIAFRGTENTKGQFIKDWGTNVSAAFGFEPAQYARARGLIEKVVDGLGKLKPPIDIYAVGHSLGGGIAQQTGYQFKRVKEVYTFNTSPVTNWSSLRLDRKVENDYPTIYPGVSHR
jgi:hypothetical protein